MKPLPPPASESFAGGTPLVLTHRADLIFSKTGQGSFTISKNRTGVLPTRPVSDEFLAKQILDVVQHSPATKFFLISAFSK